MRKPMALGLAATLLLSLLAMSVSADPAGARVQAAIAPRVRATLAGLRPGDATTVIVTMRSQAALDPVTGGPAIRPRRVIRALQAEAVASQASIDALLRTREAQGTVRSATPFWITNAISVTATADVIRELAGRPDVASITPDEIPLVQTGSTPQPNLGVVQAPALWSLGATGQGVVVASLDSGVDVSHPDLAASWRGGTNSWFDPYGQHPTTPVDLTGHGTGTMGVIVGGDAGGTSIGMAPGARWIAARVFNDAGTSTATAVHAAFQWLLDPDGNPTTADAPDIVNNSWAYGSGPGCNLAFQPDLQALRAAGIIPVFAAGNFGPGGSTSVSPANYPEALAVGSVNNTDLIYSSSGRGPSACGEPSSIYPEIVAPGVSITTADRAGRYQTASGTSMSAPHVTGALALLMSAEPSLPPSELESALLSSAVDLGTSGPDSAFGYGRLDTMAAYRSLQSAPPTVSGVAATPNPTGGASSATLTATAAGQDVAAAEWFVGVDPGVGLGTPMAVAGTSPWALSASVDVSGWADGSYVLSVRARGATAAWGTAASTSLVVATPFPGLYFSTTGNGGIPGVSGPFDDADLYRWDGVRSTRTLDATSAPTVLPGPADLDGYVRVDATHFYASFADAVTVPGLAVVQDEDVVFFDGGQWELYFDGSAHGLGGAAALDLDAIDVVGTTLFFSTVGNTNPAGLGGTADNADIYSWNGAELARVWDATANGFPGGANVDGYVRADASHSYLSFSSASTAVPGIGAVEDEDVVRSDGGTWSVFFDGTGVGLTSGAQDLDAFDVP